MALALGLSRRGRRLHSVIRCVLDIGVCWWLRKLVLFVELDHGGMCVELGVYGRVSARVLKGWWRER